ncbi:SMI1/KNR4 family protein [Psychrobacillus psychrodurans]|uniref:SMI1/KNR4 family protein n=1 Tax=Psychrobacillus psychrodurans TaxID=126157 RepID=A0A9X3L8H4_9BACI|nr:SMI1/KNR4 family protein [Psychrobacillus psychrodurans]MCZ8533347.1 SMI1/KNR4 family protein [Psychrobacillus psychrodurans]
MATFDFLKNEKHKFIRLQENELLNAEERLGFELPKELRDFYLEVGYGFIKGSNGNAINRFMDPDTIADITLREGIYEFDPDLEGIYEEDDKLVFFEVNEGVYLTLDLNNPKQTPVYFFDAQIAGSLEEFIRKIDEDAEYFMDMAD